MTMSLYRICHFLNYNIGSMTLAGGKAILAPPPARQHSDACWDPVIWSTCDHITFPAKIVGPTAQHRQNQYISLLPAGVNAGSVGVTTEHLAPLWCPWKWRNPQARSLRLLLTLISSYFPQVRPALSNMVSCLSAPALWFQATTALSGLEPLAPIL